MEWSEDIPEVSRAKTLTSCRVATHVGEVGGLMVGMESGSLEGSGFTVWRISIHTTTGSMQVLGNVHKCILLYT